jgi:pimeloyl-ACP methyl ester carboxylesterase
VVTADYGAVAPTAYDRRFMGADSRGFLPRLRRWLRRLALAVVLGVIVVVFGVAPYLIVSRMALRRGSSSVDRPNEGVTPGTLGVPFEDVTMRASDGVRLSGWWAPAASAKGVVVLAHGLFRSRLENVRKVPFLHEQGWSVLVLDLRRHGASEGDRSTFGWLERLDVRAAVALARERQPGVPVVGWGISMGAASVMLAAAEDPTIDGVVCDSVYRSVDDTVHHHLELLRELRWWLRPLPSGILAREILFWIRHLDDMDPGDVDVRRAAVHLRGRPILFVTNAGDRRMPSAIAFELKDVVGGDARVLVIPGTTHGGAYREGQPAYESAVKVLLDTVGSGYHRTALPKGTEGGRE